MGAIYLGAEPNIERYQTFINFEHANSRLHSDTYAYAWIWELQWCVQMVPRLHSNCEREVCRAILALLG